MYIYTYNESPTLLNFWLLPSANAVLLAGIIEELSQARHLGICKGLQGFARRDNGPLKVDQPIMMLTTGLSARRFQDMPGAEVSVDHTCLVQLSVRLTELFSGVS